MPFEAEPTPKPDLPIGRPAVGEIRPARVVRGEIRVGQPIVGEVRS